MQLSTTPILTTVLTYSPMATPVLTYSPYGNTNLAIGKSYLLQCFSAAPESIHGAPEYPQVGNCFIVLHVGELENWRIEQYL